MTTTRQDISFAAFDGTVLRGWLYLPAPASGPLAGVVMSHGYSATRHMGLPPFALAIAEAGVAVLVYDHRCIGDSDGAPRQLIDPFLQMRDMLTALDWLAARPEVDPARLGLWGSSYSGGEVLIVGAMDPRVQAVVANVPYAGRPLELPPLAPDQTTTDGFADLAAHIRSAGLPASFTPARLVVPQAGTDAPAVMPQDEATAWFMAAGGTPGSAWHNQTITSAQPPAAPFDPALALAHLAAQTLFIVADEDRVAPADNAILASQIMDTRAELLLIAGHHFTPYAGEALDVATKASADHFRRWLART